MPEDDDTVLVRRCLEGDAGAFETLVDKYQGPVYNTALRFVQDRADAQDVAQSAFLKAYEKLGTFDTDRKFFSWLYRITVNEALNFVGRRKRFEPLSESVPAEDAQGDDEGNREEKQRLLQKGLRQLKTDYRAVIVLKHLEGLSYAEIGRILDISEKKVKSRLFSARLMLREILSKKDMSSL